MLASVFGYVPVMTNLDPSDHARIRRHNMTAFSARRVAGLEPAIRDITTELLDDLLSQQRFDRVAGLAVPVADQRDLRAGGVPARGRNKKVKGWSGDRLTIMFGHPDEAEQLHVAQNMAALWQYCSEHRDQWKELCADPLLIPNAVEEALRFDSSVNAW